MLRFYPIPCSCNLNSNCKWKQNLTAHTNKTWQQVKTSKQLSVSGGCKPWNLEWGSAVLSVTLPSPTYILTWTLVVVSDLVMSHIWGMYYSSAALWVLYHFSAHCFGFCCSAGRCVHCIPPTQHNRATYDLQELVGTKKNSEHWTGSSNLSKCCWITAMWLQLELLLLLQYVCLFESKVIRINMRQHPKLYSVILF